MEAIGIDVKLKAKYSVDDEVCACKERIDVVVSADRQYSITAKDLLVIVDTLRTMCPSWGVTNMYVSGHTASVCLESGDAEVDLALLREFPGKLFRTLNVLHEG